MVIIYTLVSVLIISLISFVGVVTLVLKKDLLNRSIFVLVGLAVGALLGDVFIHVVPEMYENAGDPTLISLVFIAGILIFFILEKILHWHHHHSSEHSGENLLPVGRMVLVSDGVHNFIEIGRASC